jgi:hypothetical protein
MSKIKKIRTNLLTEFPSSEKTTISRKVLSRTERVDGHNWRFIVLDELLDRLKSFRF